MKQATDLDAPPATAGDDRLARGLEEYRALLETGRKIDRQAFLARHADVAPELAECLEGLEFVHQVAGALSLSTLSMQEGPAAERASATLGDFRIIREIGRGGMGIVYEAEQLSLGRRVALKMLPFAAALDAKQLQRFTHEAKAAAQLHHSHIVPVFFVGHDRGVHFYAMQLIPGCTLAQVIADLRAGTGWSPIQSSAADDSIRTPVTGRDSTAAARTTEGSNRRPAYFRTVAQWGVQAAEALEHAHLMGVVHRDVKPSNLLIDGWGKLWITDFGLARFQTDAGLTMSGDLVGTLRYMSPEQVEAKRGVVDHRSDIYSLGATLFEALTFEAAVHGRDRQELLNHVLNEEPRPLRRVNPAIPRDLETIVLKALSKSAAERYGTAAEMAEDLRRFLQDQPIQARPPNAKERLAKWARRHRGVVRAAIGMLFLAVVGLSLSTFLIFHKNLQTQRALQKVRESRAFARRVVNEMYVEVAEKWLAQQPGLQPIQERFLVKALEFYQDLGREGELDPEEQQQSIEAYKKVGFIQQRLGRFADSDHTYTRAIRLAEGLAADLPAEPRHRHILASLHNNRGSVHAKAGETAAAEADYRRAILIQKDLLARFPKWHEASENLASFYGNLAALLTDQGKLDEALALQDQSVELHRELTERFPDSANYLAHLGGAYSNRGRVSWFRGQLDEVERFWLKAVALKQKLLERRPGDYEYRESLSRAYNNLGTLFFHTDRLEEAEKLWNLSLAMHKRLAADFPGEIAFRQELGHKHEQLARIFRQKQRHDQAEAGLRKALGLAEELTRGAPRTPSFERDLWAAHNNLANLLAHLGRHDEAGRSYRAAAEVIRRLAQEHSATVQYREDLADSVNNLGYHYQTRNRLNDAEPLIRESLKLRHELADQFPDAAKHRERLADTYANLGHVTREMGLRDEAEQAYRQCFAVWRQLVDSHPRTPIYRQKLAGAAILLADYLKELGRSEDEIRGPLLDAERAVREGLALQPGHPQALNAAALFLAQCPDESVRDAEDAVLIARRGVERSPQSSQLWTTLGTACYRAGKWQAALEALQTSLKIDGGDCSDWFVLAMSCHRLGDVEEARRWFDQADAWMARTGSKDHRFLRLREEAADVLGVRQEDPSQGN